VSDIIVSKREMAVLWPLVHVVYYSVVFPAHLFTYMNNTI